jgi:hypothetical protein
VLRDEEMNLFSLSIENRKSIGALSLGPSAIFKFLQKMGMPATARSTKADSVVSEEQRRTSRNAAGSPLSPRFDEMNPSYWH